MYLYLNSELFMHEFHRNILFSLISSLFHPFYPPILQLYKYSLKIPSHLSRLLQLPAFQHIKVTDDPKIICHIRHTGTTPYMLPNRVCTFLTFKEANIRPIVTTLLPRNADGYFFCIRQNISVAFSPVSLSSA